MRKSRYVTFLVAGAATAALTACDQGGAPEDVVLYADPAACAKDAGDALCNQAYATARNEHIQLAPKFATQAECETAGFAQCEQAEARTAEGGQGSFFMPMMMGYMMGRMLSPGAAALPGQTPRPTARPIYGDRSGYLYAGGNNLGRLPAGTTSLGPNGIATRVATRGGFGNTARSFSGGS
jgi:uncharacterized protein YgiB involved in biofilm formation